MWEMRNAYKILVRRPFWKSKHRRDDNIKMHLKEIECEDVDWIQLAQDIANGELF
jgi:hypothetical protein